MFENRLKIAMEFLEKTDLKSLEVGRVEVADGVYGIVSSYETKPATEAKFEAHRKYVDIQYMIDGEEKILVTDIDNLTVTEDIEEKDLIFYSDDVKNPDEKVIKSGDYVTLYPQEAHKPTVMLDTPITVKKIVMKVLL